MTLEDTVANWNQSELVRLLKNAPGTQYQEADDANKHIMRDWVKSLLQKGPVMVTFVKADGTEREMKCTLSHDFLPATPASTTLTESKPRKQPDEHSLRVFDLDKYEWRSFRYERVRKISAEIVFG